MHHDHQRLVNAVMKAGVKVYFNKEGCYREKDLMGWYSQKRREVVVCQENRINGRPRQQVDWTAGDYDTLRHEAQHVIQDCMVGRIGDQRWKPVYSDPVALAKEVLGTDKMRKIYLKYRAAGYSDKDVLLEFEAFSVAEMNEPIEQVVDVKRFCGAV